MLTPEACHSFWYQQLKPGPESATP